MVKNIKGGEVAKEVAKKITKEVDGIQVRSVYDQVKAFVKIQRLPPGTHLKVDCLAGILAPCPVPGICQALRWRNII